MPFDLWPVAESDTGWLRIHGAVQPAEVGAAVWSLISHSGPTGDDFVVPDTPAAALRLLVDLGHDPNPEVEFRGAVVRVWNEDGGTSPPPAGRTHVDVDRADLPGLLRSAQSDLVGFLEAARRWADTTAPEHAGQFVAALDEGLRITEPLPL